MKRFAIPLPFVVLLSFACSSSASKPAAPPPNVPPTPTPGIHSRLNPDVVEETETGFVERLPKADYIKVDEGHVRRVNIRTPIAFFKEDENYYYVSVNKVLPEEKAAQNQTRPAPSAGSTSISTPTQKKAPEPLVPLSDFENLSPARIPSPLRLEAVAASGLPAAGMWRASFCVADVNGDGIPDIVSPPPRMGDGKLRIWIGDGAGKFAPWPLSYTEKGVRQLLFSVDYGGVAVGDIDHDGHADLVSASHGNGLVSLFGDGKGGFTIVRTGLPTKEFSSQAVALVDAKGDGNLVLVAARDVPPDKAGTGQLRDYVFHGREQGWEFLKDGISGPFSNSVTAWDFDGDGRQDVLTGNLWAVQTRLLWKSNGDDTFSLMSIPVMEIESFHHATSPGTFGKNRARAFADSYVMHTTVPETVRAAGISLYAFEDGEWSRHRLWRQKSPKSNMTGLAMGDLDGDGLDDVVFADNDQHRVRILLQQSDGSFAEIAEDSEPVLDSTGQCVRLSDLDGDGRLDIVVSKTVSSANQGETGGWNVYLNRGK